MKKLVFILLLLVLGIACFSQSRHISATTKRIVFARDGGVCQCCGNSLNLEFDHITPFSCGGSNDASNIQLLCKPCNRSKSNSCYCKIHNKKVGTNCCDSKSNISLSAKPAASASTSKQCTGTTKKGSRCRNKTTNQNGRCHLH